LVAALLPWVNLRGYEFCLSGSAKLRQLLQSGRKQDHHTDRWCS